MKNYFFLLLSITLLFVTSCNSDDDSMENTVENGVNGSEAIADCTYLRLREGSKLVQNFDVNGAITTTTAEIVDAMDIDGGQLAVVEDNLGNRQYLTCIDDKIIIAATTATTLQGAQIEDVLLTLDLGGPLNEELPVGVIEVDVESYGSTFTNVNEYFGKVVERNLSMEVEGVNYTDVVRYELNVFTTLDGFADMQHTAKTNYYVAPDAGFIMSESFAIQFGYEFLSFTTTLVSYEY